MLMELWYCSESDIKAWRYVIYDVYYSVYPEEDNKDLMDMCSLYQVQGYTLHQFQSVFKIRKISTSAVWQRQMEKDQI